jgi:membrane protein required for beta-lactamase induction
MLLQQHVRKEAEPLLQFGFRSWFSLVGFFLLVGPPTASSLPLLFPLAGLGE